MNRKILFSADTGEEFEIQHDSIHGYRIFRVMGEQSALLVGGYYHTAGELVDALVDLAIFSGEDAVALADVSKSINALRSTIEDYVTSHFEP